MCNFHPRLYAWLSKNIWHPKADLVQSVIGTFGFTETGMPYPLTAKYNMTLCGLETENISRVRNKKELTDYVKDSVAQMKYATDELEKYLEV